MAYSHKIEQSLRFKTDDTRRFSVGAAEYVALAKSQQIVLPVKEDNIPLTVIPIDRTEPWTTERLKGYLADLDVRDDLSCQLFRKFLIFCGTTPGPIQLKDDVLRYMKKTETRHRVVEVVEPGCNASSSERGFVKTPLVEGPYLWTEQRLRPIFRLYEDKASAFIDPLQPSDSRIPYNTLDILSRDPATRLIAVPPRQIVDAWMKQRDHIRGKRILIKDIFDIAGLRKTACNRAYYDLSTPAQDTAPMVQRLIDRGAILVGKSRLSSMVSREEPSESFDYEAPFNPRGDGYQSPAGSSSGSAAALAAYDWLDYGIGTDCNAPDSVFTTASLTQHSDRKCQAASNGQWRLFYTYFQSLLARRRHGALLSVSCNTNRASPTTTNDIRSLFDTPAVFARDIRNLDGFVDDWCNGRLSTTITRPTSIIMPRDYFPVKSGIQQNIVNHFVRDLSKSFKINIRTVYLRDLWADFPPLEACGQSLQKYLKNVGQNSFFYDFYHSTDSFREEYERKYHRAPAVNRVTKWRWEVAKGISQAQRDEAVRRLRVYKNWLLEQVLVGENPIVVLPVMDAVPTYRDTPPSSPATQEAWDQLWLAPVLGSPEITLPLGQIPYHSTVSEREEQLPVAVSLMGLPGTDLSLINAAKTVLEKSGRPTRVATGREMFAEEGWEMVERTASF